MGLTPAQRQQNKRARDKGLPEPHNSADIKATQEARAVKESELLRLLEEVASLDKEGKRYRSEARSYTKLVRLFFGQPENGDADEPEDGEEGPKVKKPKGPKQPNPSESKIRIQNSEVDPAAKTKGKRRRSIEDITYEVDDVIGFWR